MCNWFIVDTGFCYTWFYDLEDKTLYLGDIMNYREQIKMVESCLNQAKIHIRNAESFLLELKQEYIKEELQNKNPVKR